MMGAPLQLTKSGNGLDILANSEMVIEARMLNNERVLEGPFGEYPGTYSGVRRLNVFKVTSVSFRDDPIFESLYIGSKSWTEHDTLLGINTCATVYNQLKQGFPEVVAVNALYQGRDDGNYCREKPVCRLCKICCHAVRSVHLTA